MIIQNFVRDQLANERTYLAWLITGITMMGVGTALVKFNGIKCNSEQHLTVVNVLSSLGYLDRQGVSIVFV